MKRNWTEVGEEFVTEAYASRNATPDHAEVRGRIEAQIDELKWREPHGDFPFTPGMALQEAIRQFDLPRVSQVAISGYLRLPDGPETATYSLYGIEANYANGRIRLYLLDVGTRLISMAFDELDVPADAVEE